MKIDPTSSFDFSAAAKNLDKQLQSIAAIADDNGAQARQRDEAIVQTAKATEYIKGEFV